jgi:hypothetical protein
MKLTVLEVLGSSQAMKELGSNKLPIQLSLRLSANQRLLDECVDQFNDRKQELINKFGKISKETGQATVEPKNIKKFTEKVKEITSEEVDLDLQEIPAADFGEGFEVAPNVLSNLGWMIKNEQS